MKKILKNKLGMTLIEVLLAVAILVIMIWAFAPFVASTFKQIAQAGRLHVGLSLDVSKIDKDLADEYYGTIATFPVKVGGSDNIDVSGIHLSSGQLHTFYSDITSYISSDDILYEGYGSDGFYNDFYSIGFLPEITDKKFFKNDHTYVVTLKRWAEPPLEPPVKYIVDEEFDILHTDPKNDIDPDSVDASSNVFIVASQFPDDVGGNPDKIGYLLLIPDSLGLDNPNSPYELMIETKDTGQNFTEEPIIIHVMLPLYQAVGEMGYERIASHIDYWVDKYSYSDGNYGEDGIVVVRLPYGRPFYDVLWYEGLDINEVYSARYYTVGAGGNLWHREHEVEWTQVDKNINTDLNRIVRLNNQFVVIGDAGNVLTSTDGLTWHTWPILSLSAPPNPEYDLVAIAADASKYIMIAEDGTIYHTANFLYYTKVEPAASGLASGVNDVIWIGDAFVAVGDEAYIAFSADGLTNWQTVATDDLTLLTSADPVGKNDFNAVYIYKGMVLIVGNNGQIHRFNSDGPSTGIWGLATVVEPVEGKKDLFDITYSRKTFVTVGEDGKVMYSLNGTTWTDCNTMEDFNTEYDIYAVAGRE